MLSFSPDEIPNALAHASKHREQLPYLVISSVCGYVSVSFVLLMIKMYGATVTEMVKSLRKVPTLTRTRTRARTRNRARTRTQALTPTQTPIPDPDPDPGPDPGP